MSSTASQTIDTLYQQLTKSLEYSRKSRYEKLDILDKKLEEGEINEGKYLVECNKLKKQSEEKTRLGIEATHLFRIIVSDIVNENNSDNEEDD